MGSRGQSFLPLMGSGRVFLASPPLPPPDRPPPEISPPLAPPLPPWAILVGPWPLVGALAVPAERGLFPAFFLNASLIFTPLANRPPRLLLAKMATGHGAWSSISPTERW